MTEETRDLQRRIDELEIKHAMRGVIVNALLELLPKDGVYEQILQPLIEQYDAYLLYATSLSDEQRHALLDRLNSFLEGNQRGQARRFASALLLNANSIPLMQSVFRFGPS